MEAGSLVELESRAAGPEFESGFTARSGNHRISCSKSFR